MTPKVGSQVLPIGHSDPDLFFIFCHQLIPVPTVPGTLATEIRVKNEISPKNVVDWARVSLQTYTGYPAGDFHAEPSQGDSHNDRTLLTGVPQPLISTKHVFWPTY